MTQDIQAIVFDFDGTVADSYLEVLRVLYQLVHQQPLPAENISRLRSLSLWSVLRELGVPVWRMPLLLGQMRRAMRGHITRVEPVSGIKDTLSDLSKTHKIFIQSSNSAENVKLWLKRFELEDAVTAVYGSVGMLGKARNLRWLLRENDLSAKHVWYVGDEPRDIKAAKKLDVKSVGVTWGFSNIARLERVRPDALVFNTDELKRCFFDNYEK